MINWIDILSPKLRDLHQDWIHYRGTFLMPGLQHFNNFAASPNVEDAERFSVTVILPAEGAPVFKHIGDGLINLMPDCKPGMRFTELRSPVVRATVTQPFHRITTSRQPEARRGRGNTGVARDHEMLLLPFSDNKLRVCIVHAIYDLAGIDWKKAFA